MQQCVISVLILSLMHNNFLLCENDINTNTKRICCCLVFFFPHELLVQIQHKGRTGHVESVNRKVFAVCRL